MPDDEAVVAARSVEVRFGGELALRRVSFSLHESQALVVEGPSGSGKSTLLRVIAGLLRPTSGDASLGRGIRIGLTLEEPRLWPWMRAADNVRCFAGLNGVSVSRSAAIDRLDELRLGDVGNVRASKLSQGMRRRVQLAGALALNADLLLLDEPTASLDADTALVVWEALERRRRDTRTPVVVATHDGRWRDVLAADGLDLGAQTALPGVT